MIHAENYGERFIVHPENLLESKHPLLEAAIQYMDIPRDLAFEVTIFSEAPSGASTGTSATVTVALIGALDCLTPGRMTPHDWPWLPPSKRPCSASSAVSRTSCARLWRDQLHRDKQYPHASVSQIQILIPSVGDGGATWATGAEQVPRCRSIR
jgi:D-glycero-alpha-D-manno-heptose-7-phosphate kinase